jgi:hypothetical protein
MLSSPASCHFFLDPNILLSTLFSDILNTCSYLGVKDFHTHITGETVVLV